MAGHRIAVHEHDRIAGAAVGVVQPDAVHGDETALGRMPALGPARNGRVDAGQQSKACGNGEQCGLRTLQSS